MKIKNLFAGILIGALLILPISCFGYDTNNQKIKVGLYYGSTGRVSFNIGNEPISFYEAERLLGSISSYGKYSISFEGKIFTTGEVFTDFNLAVSKAREINSGFVYYDKGSFYIAAKSQQEGDWVAGGEAVVVSVDGVPAFGYSALSEVSFGNLDDTISIEGAEYRGRLIIKKDSGKLSAINYVNMDEYLKGVVGKEMSASWEKEALKAQAVVARNYAITNMDKHRSSGFDICGSTHCQAYGGIKSEASSVNEAVDETTGKLLYYNNEVVKTFYSSSSGGKTENNENVWGGVAMPYLRGIDDPYSVGYPNDNWVVELSDVQVKEALRGRGVDIGDILDVRITKASDNGRAMELTVLGTKGTKVFAKEAIRSSIAKDSLKSTFFTISKAGEINGSGNGKLPLEVPKGVSSELGIAYENLNNVLPSSYTASVGSSGKYVINGHGWGHGVGLSQYGAKGMAKKGFTYEAILKYYFTGVEIR
ncbi:MAG: SpoIID/LytB domain-containing protein [Filifactoraceae bacterium]